MILTVNVFSAVSAGIETAVKDLCGSANPNISLFMVTPSVRAGGAVGLENAFVPNVAHTSEQAFDMLRFVGKLMGIAIRYNVRCAMIFVAMPRCVAVMFGATYCVCVF